MINPSKITRNEFLDSRYLKVAPIDIEVNLIHHNRFVIEIILDQISVVSKKKYNEIKKFSEDLDHRLGMKEFAMDGHIRSSEQYKEIETLFRKINAGYLIVSKENDSDKQVQKKTQIRNSLYNLLFNSIDQLQSSEEETNQTKEQEKKVARTISEIFPRKKDQPSPAMEPQKVEREKNEGLDLKNMLKQIYKPRRETEEIKRSEYLKNIKTLWIKQNQKWTEKPYSLTDNALILYEKEDNSKQIIVLKKLDMTFIEVPHAQINITHRLLIKSIEIRLNDILQAEHDHTNLNLYLTLFTSLKEISYKSTQNIYNIVGVKISNKKNKIIPEVEKKPAKELSLRVTHEAESTAFTMPIDSTTYLQLPITNNYGKVDIEVVECKETSILPNFKENRISFTLPCQNIYDQLFNEKPKRKTPEMHYHMLESKHCNYLIKLDYFERSNRHSYSACKLKDKFEGDQIPVELTREQFRIQRNRLKRIIYSTEQHLNFVSELKNFQYPLRSYIFYLVLFFSILLFDANYLVHYFIAFLCSVLIYCHPTFYSYCREAIHILKINEAVQTLETELAKRSNPPQKIRLKKQVQKRLFLQRFAMRLKNNRNIYKKYKRLQQILLKGQLLLTAFVTFSEKIKNTFMWYHHKKTKELLLLLLLALVVICFLPLRLIILYLLFKEYNKGITHHIRIRNLNRAIIYEIFKLCIEDNNFNEIKGYLTQNTKVLEKKSVSEYNAFEKKIREYIEQILQIDYDHDIFVQAKTISELINSLSDCKKRFIIPIQICQKYGFNEEWANNGSSLTKIMLVIYGFLVNIPSDRNILGVKTSEADKNQPDNQSQDQEDQPNETS